MGQPINVVMKPGSRPGVVRFETNRWLTGMGHETYRSPEDIVNTKTVDELARRLFATGEVSTVHVNGSVVTVELNDADVDGEHLLDVIRGLHIHYPPDENGAVEATTESPATDPA